MVRLRREIEGIRVDLAVPVPAYALSPGAAAILPRLERRIDALEPGRLLLAGVVPAERVQRLAAAGHTVTVCDVAEHEVAALHGRLSPEVGARVTIVAKPYGNAAFSPSSFDVIVHLDALHRFVRPKWAAAKMFRELKYDGLLVARLLVHGPPPEGLELPEGGRTSAGLGRLLERIEALCRGRAAMLLLDADGRDAVERGAHLGGHDAGGDWRQTHAALTDKLVAEQVLVGHSQRLRLLRLTFGGRAAVAALALGLAGRLPELAGDADLAGGRPRVVGLVARKVLGAGKLRGSAVIGR